MIFSNFLMVAHENKMLHTTIYVQCVKSNHNPLNDTKVLLSFTPPITKTEIIIVHI